MNFGDDAFSSKSGRSRRRPVHAAGAGRRCGQSSVVSGQRQGARHADERAGGRDAVRQTAWGPRHAQQPTPAARRGVPRLKFFKTFFV